jgi:large subunit ribosomal protein L24
MKLKKGDQIVVITGKDRLKRGKIVGVSPTENKILVEGVNLRKKHLKPKKAGEKGETVLVPAPFDASNAKLVCKKCGQPTRVGYRKEGDQKFRVCKKCSQET